ELLLISQESITKARRPIQPGTVHQNAGRIDRAWSIIHAPFAGQVEVLERETDRIHDLVARSANRITAMLFHTLANRGFIAATAVALFQRRHVWRRQRRRRT